MKKINIKERLEIKFIISEIRLVAKQRAKNARKIRTGN
jgi:hypothetical protein